MVRPSSRAFFQLGPAFAAPALNRNLIPLAGAFDWLLAAPVNLLEQAPNVGQRVCHTECPLDHAAHTRPCPHRTPKTEVFGPLTQPIRQLVQLCLAQAFLRTAAFAPMQPFNTVFSSAT